MSTARLTYRVDRSRAHRCAARLPSAQREASRAVGTRALVGLFHAQLLVDVRGGRARRRLSRPRAPVRRDAARFAPDHRQRQRDEHRARRLSSRRARLFGRRRASGARLRQRSGRRDRELVLSQRSDCIASRRTTSPATNAAAGSCARSGSRSKATRATTSTSTAPGATTSSPRRSATTRRRAVNRTIWRNERAWPATTCSSSIIPPSPTA